MHVEEGQIYSRRRRALSGDIGHKRTEEWRRKNCCCAVVVVVAVAIVLFPPKL